jgi:glutaredoxin
MKFEEPNPTGYTIYSKSGCVFCNKSKHDINTKNIVPVIIDCDEYLLDNKPAFLEFIKLKAEKDYRSFPMIFYNGQFVGGYVELKTHLQTHTQHVAAASSISFSTEF